MWTGMSWFCWIEQLWLLTKLIVLIVFYQHLGPLGVFTSSISVTLGKRDKYFYISWKFMVSISSHCRTFLSSICPLSFVITSTCWQRYLYLLLYLMCIHAVYLPVSWSTFFSGPYVPNITIYWDNKKPSSRGKLRLI